jgi:hypothetical protein
VTERQGSLLSWMLDIFRQTAGSGCCVGRRSLNRQSPFIRVVAPSIDPCAILTSRRGVGSSVRTGQKKLFIREYNDFRFLRMSVSYPTLARSHFDKDWVIIISTTATALGVVIGVWKGLAELPTTDHQIDNEHEHDWRREP